AATTRLQGSLLREVWDFQGFPHNVTSHDPDVLLRRFGLCPKTSMPLAPIQNGFVTPTRGTSATTHPSARFCLASGAMRLAEHLGFEGRSSMASMARNMQTAQFETQRE